MIYCALIFVLQHLHMVLHYFFVPAFGRTRLRLARTQTVHLGGCLVDERQLYLEGDGRPAQDVFGDAVE